MYTALENQMEIWVRAAVYIYATVKDGKELLSVIYVTFWFFNKHELAEQQIPYNKKVP